MSDEVVIDESEADDEYEPEPFDWEEERLQASKDLDEEQAEALDEAAKVARPKTPIAPHALDYLRKHRVLKASALAELPDPDWFIEDLIPEAPRTMIQGQGGSYKSFLVLDWMLCAATGRSWHGRAIKPGRCMYIAGEGARGLRKRINAWLHHNHATWADLENRIDFIAEPLQFFAISGDSEKHQWQKDAWKTLVANGGVQYIVVDTLHTMSSGAEENSSSDMGKVLETATYIAGGTDGARLFFVHHKGKTGTFGGRGSSALRDDFDVTLDLITKDAKGNPIGELLAQLIPDKIRDAEPFQPLNLQLARYAEDDSRQKSLYIESVEESAHGPGPNAPATPGETKTVRECREAILRHHLDEKFDEGWGSPRIRDALEANGYSFGKNLVAKVVAEMKATQMEVQHMRGQG